MAIGAIPLPGRHIATLLDQHPDAVIFRSMPRCQSLRPAGLLAEIGDCCARVGDSRSDTVHHSGHRAACKSPEKELLR